MFDLQSVLEREAVPKRLQYPHPGIPLVRNTQSFCLLSQALGGARGVKCMVWETSLLDAEEVSLAICMLMGRSSCADSAC